MESVIRYSFTPLVQPSLVVFGYVSRTSNHLPKVSNLPVTSLARVVMVSVRPTMVVVLPLFVLSAGGNGR